MELEPTTPTTSSITDEQRLAAQARTKIIQPLNPFFKPEPATVTTVKETQANIDRDSETTGDASQLLRPRSGAMNAEQATPSRTKAIVSASTAGIVLLLAAYGVYIFG